MSGSISNPGWAARITVPVKRVGDRWEFFYGGDVPVRDGALGELTFGADQITEVEFRRRVTRTLKVKIFEEGTELLIALSDRSKDGQRIGPWPDIVPTSVPSGTTRFERVALGPCRKDGRDQGLVSHPERGGLWLKLKGLERSELSGSAVRMPETFEPAMARSLNHAFTLLSQEHEKHRISNTGSVYTHVFYKDRNERWYPLDDLRTGVQASGERQLLNDLWAQVEQMLGWRPAALVPKRKRT